MKSLLLVALLVASVCATAQTTPAPFKGANIILIQTPDSANVALKKMASAFVVSGFVPEKLDTELRYLTTRPKTFGKTTPAVFAYKVLARRTPGGGTTLEITGDCTVQVDAQPVVTSMQWNKSTTPTQQNKVCFNEAEKAAKAYLGGVVKYTVSSVSAAKQ